MSRVAGPSAVPSVSVDEPFAQSPGMRHAFSKLTFDSTEAPSHLRFGLSKPRACHFRELQFRGWKKGGTASECARPWVRPKVINNKRKTAYFHLRKARHSFYQAPRLAKHLIYTLDGEIPTEARAPVRLTASSSKTPISKSV